MERDGDGRETVKQDWGQRGELWEKRDIKEGREK
jgi:hypothetical protein